MRRAVFLTSSEIWEIGHGPGHPLKPERLQRTHLLLSELGVFEESNVYLVAPRLATDDELGLFHTREYIQAVRALSAGDQTIYPGRYGFGPGDNPVFRGMFESEARKVGSALQAAELLAGNECDVAFSYSGGLHHGGADFASGFCVFNDAAVAINWLVKQGYRVAYVDIDVHHGDGVQNAFYHSDRVLTISLHQDGRTLFPGSGSISEIGQGPGKGYSVNLPFPPYTNDSLYISAFNEIVTPLLDRFSADILVTQLGVDTHALDPLASLLLSTSGQEAVISTLEGLGPRWLALGGGGYHLDVVPRAWTLAFGIMAGLRLPEELPKNYRAKYGGQWLRDKETYRLDETNRPSIADQVASTVREVKRVHQLI